MEKGIKTSEFWYNIFITLLTFVLVIRGDVPPEIWMGGTALQGSAYAVSRGYRKGR